MVAGKVRWFSKVEGCWFETHTGNSGGAGAHSLNGGLGGAVLEDDSQTMYS